MYLKKTKRFLQVAQEEILLNIIFAFPKMPILMTLISSSFQKEKLNPNYAPDFDLPWDDDDTVFDNCIHHLTMRSVEIADASTAVVTFAPFTKTTSVYIYIYIILPRIIQVLKAPYSSIKTQWCHGV